LTSPAEPNQKQSWPLYVVAGLSFVPFLGILFGGAGATWGFISSRRNAVKAAMVAMAGALLNMVFIVVVALAAVPDATDHKVGTELAQRELLQLVVAIDKFHGEGHPYPVSLDALRRQLGPLHPIPLLDQSAGIFRFQTFQYHVAPDGESYDVFGAGADKKPGTADDVRPKLPDSLQEHTGYRPHINGEQP
jgi:hypothetical protein